MYEWHDMGCFLHTCRNQPHVACLGPLRADSGLVVRCWAPSQYPKRRLSVRSRKLSKPRDLYLELSDRYEIWQAPRQQCCWCACQISKRHDNLKYQSRGFETLRDLMKRRLFGYWDGALIAIIEKDKCSVCLTFMVSRRPAMLSVAWFARLSEDTLFI